LKSSVGSNLVRYYTIKEFGVGNMLLGTDINFDREKLLGH